MPPTLRGRLVSQAPTARAQAYTSSKYSQALDTDTGYMSDWGTQIMPLGISYGQQDGANTGGGSGLTPGNAIGWDKYGRITAALKASYAITPALEAGAGVSSHW